MNRWDHFYKHPRSFELEVFSSSNWCVPKEWCSSTCLSRITLKQTIIFFQTVTATERNWPNQSVISDYATPSDHMTDWLPGDLNIWISWISSMQNESIKMQVLILFENFLQIMYFINIAKQSKVSSAIPRVTSSGDMTDWYNIRTFWILNIKNESMKIQVLMKNFLFFFKIWILLGNNSLKDSTAREQITHTQRVFEINR